MGTLQDIEAIVKGLVKREPKSFEWEAPWSHGSVQFADRVQAVAMYCASTWQGGFVEIGAHTGGTTVRLASIATIFGKRVLVVDPWEPGTQNCEGWEYGVFLKNIEPYKDVVDVLRLPSQDKKAIETIKGRHLCFSLVDGLHEFEVARGDILACSHAPIICVDDVGWNAGVELAFDEAARELGREAVRDALIKEGYLI